MANLLREFNEAGGGAARAHPGDSGLSGTLPKLNGLQVRPLWAHTRRPDHGSCKVRAGPNSRSPARGGKQVDRGPHSDRLGPSHGSGGAYRRRAADNDACDSRLLAISGVL